MNVPVGHLSIVEGMPSRKYDRPGGGADRVGHEGPVKDHSFFGKPVDVGCLVPVGPIGGDRLVSVIIGEDEENVQRLGDQRCLTGQGKCDEKEG